MTPRPGASPRVDPVQPNGSVARAQPSAFGAGLRLGWTKILAVSVVLFALIRTFLVEAFKIPSGSMENTLQVGDFLLVNKLVYGAEVPFTHKRLPRLREPRRGDVIVFEWPEDPTKNFVKRLVGVPGDTVEMREGTLIRNGAVLSERYVEHTEPDIDPSPEDFRWQRNYRSHRFAASEYLHQRNNWGPLVVPREVFRSRRQRDNSLDSRYWGFMPDSLVKGRPFVIYYSYAPDTVDTFAGSRIRWTRLGEQLLVLFHHKEPLYVWPSRATRSRRTKKARSINTSATSAPTR
jgi:signal peptidase I